MPQRSRVSQSCLCSQCLAGYLPRKRLDKYLLNEWINECMNEWKEINRYLWRGRWNVSIVSTDTGSVSRQHYWSIRGFSIILWQRECEPWRCSMPPHFYSLWFDLGGWKGFAVTYLDMYMIEKRRYRIILFSHLVLPRFMQLWVQSTQICDSALLCFRILALKVVKIEVSLLARSWLVLILAKAWTVIFLNIKLLLGLFMRLLLWFPWVIISLCFLGSTKDSWPSHMSQETLLIVNLSWYVRPRDAWDALILNCSKDVAISFIIPDLALGIPIFLCLDLNILLSSSSTSFDSSSVLAVWVEPEFLLFSLLVRLDLRPLSEKRSSLPNGLPRCPWLPSTFSPPGHVELVIRASWTRRL